MGEGLGSGEEEMMNKGILGGGTIGGSMVGTMELGGEGREDGGRIEEEVVRRKPGGWLVIETGSTGEEEGGTGIGIGMDGGVKMNQSG